MISQRDMRSELVLSEALEDLQGYDFVLLDTAPRGTFSTSTVFSTSRRY